LAHLLGGPGERRELYLQPERIWLRMRHRRLTEEQLHRWLDGLLALADAVERALTSDPGADWGAPPATPMIRQD
jgi:hypothetical protein